MKLFHEKFLEEAGNDLLTKYRLSGKMSRIYMGLLICKAIDTEIIRGEGRRARRPSRRVSGLTPLMLSQLAAENKGGIE